MNDTITISISQFTRWAMSMACILLNVHHGQSMSFNQIINWILDWIHEKSQRLISNPIQLKPSNICYYLRYEICFDVRNGELCDQSLVISITKCWECNSTKSSTFVIFMFQHRKLCEKDFQIQKKKQSSCETQQFFERFLKQTGGRCFCFS